jgi:hypothetical protein
MITERQIVGAKIRAADEEYINKHRKPLGGGYEVPSNKERYEYLAKKFGLPVTEISYFMTYSRQCTHPWSAGACPQCPS